MPSADVRHDPARHRFEIFIDGTPAGRLDYLPEDDTFALTHTEVLPQFEGNGVGSTLVVEALKQIRDLDGQVLPYCPFIPKVILDNPEFIELVPPLARPQFGLE